MAQQSWRAGLDFSTPLIPVTSAGGSADRPLPPQKSFLSLGADNLVLSALKKSETGENIIVRAFEIEGTPAQSPVTFLGKENSFRQTNLLEENPQAEQKILRVRPYEIETIKLSAP